MFSALVLFSFGVDPFFVLKGMRHVYFEPQVAALCGQHLLNNLLQGRYFSVAEMAQVAAELDSKERQLGFNFDVSENVDESGNFSIQVLQACLEPYGILLTQEDAVVTKAVEDAIARPAPTAPGFVFNFEQHWFAIRKLEDGRLYRLDSVQPKPTIVGEGLCIPLLVLSFRLRTQRQANVREKKPQFIWEP